MVVRDEGNKTIKSIDLTIPFENRWEALQAARQGKICKYRPLVGQLESKGYAVDLDAFIVGSIGGWHNNNDRVIDSLIISLRYAELMRNLMISNTIRWTRDIYVEHVSRVRQYR